MSPGASSIRAAISRSSTTRPPNRKFLAGPAWKGWQAVSCSLRGQWLQPSDPRGLPGGNSLSRNLLALLRNQPNDHREAFPPARRPNAAVYRVGFALQLWEYAISRHFWYPVQVENVLVCFKTAQWPPFRMAALED